MYCCLVIAKAAWRSCIGMAYPPLTTVKSHLALLELCFVLVVAAYVYRMDSCHSFYNGKSLRVFYQCKDT